MHKYDCHAQFYFRLMKTRDDNEINIRGKFTDSLNGRNIRDKFTDSLNGRNIRDKFTDSLNGRNIRDKFTDSLNGRNIRDKFTDSLKKQKEFSLAFFFFFFNPERVPMFSVCIASRFQTRSRFQYQIR